MDRYICMSSEFYETRISDLNVLHFHQWDVTLTFPIAKVKTVPIYICPCIYIYWITEMKLGQHFLWNQFFNFFLPRPILVESKEIVLLIAAERL